MKNRMVMALIGIGFFSTSLFSQTPKSSTLPLPIAQVIYSPDGKLLAAVVGGKNKPSRIAIWDLATNQMVQNVSPSTPVEGIDFSPDSKVLAIALGTKAQLLDPIAGKRISEIEHPNTVRAVAYGPPHRLATSCADNRVRIWDTRTKKELVRTEASRESMSKLAFSSSGKWILGVDSKTWTQWSAIDGKTGPKAKEEWGTTQGVAFSADGQWAIRNILNDGSVIVADADTGVVRTTKKFPGGVYHFTYSPASGVYASSTAFGEEMGHRVFVGQVRLTPLTETEQKEIDALVTKLDAEGMVERELASKDLLQLGVKAEPTLAKVAKESPSAEVRLRSRKLKEQLASRVDQLPVAVGGINSLGISPDGKTIAVGGKDGIVRLMDAKIGKLNSELKVETK